MRQSGSVRGTPSQSAFLPRLFSKSLNGILLSMNFCCVMTQPVQNLRHNDCRSRSGAAVVIWHLNSVLRMPNDNYGSMPCIAFNEWVKVPSGKLSIHPGSNRDTYVVRQNVKFPEKP